MGHSFTTKLPTETQLLDFYEQLGWNDFLKLTPTQLLTAMQQSYFSIYVYSQDKLIATGRVISDGVINAYICGLGVLPDYRRRGIGSEILKSLANHCTRQNLHVQFFCEEHLADYYKKCGFEEFAVGMKWRGYECKQKDYS